MTWSRVAIFPSSADRRDLVASAMFASGAEGVHEDGQSFVTHLPGASDAPAFVARVRAADEDLEASITPVEETDWSESWRDRIHAHELGALTVAPPAEPFAVTEGAPRRGSPTGATPPRRS